MSMLNPNKILNQVMGALDGKNASHARRFLNLVLPQVIPFNRPLALKIKRLTPSGSEVEIPFKRANKNHLGGLHACALATVGEYAAGILILRRGDPARQRVVLKNLNVDFMKQGRGHSVATAEWPAEAPQSIEGFRASQDSHDIKMVTVVRSKDGTDLAHVHTLWQVKPWSKVRKK